MFITVLQDGVLELDSILELLMNINDFYYYVLKN